MVRDHDTNESNVPPIYIEFIPSFRSNSRPWTGTYILKQGSRYYRTLVNSCRKTSINLTCHKRNANPKYGKTCKFRVTLKIVNIFDPQIDGFHDRTNLTVKPSTASVAHSCGGYQNIHDARAGKHGSTK